MTKTSPDKAASKLSQKNPWMSLWLSGVNAWFGAARGFWMAELHRQQAAMINEMTQQMMRFWTGAWMLPPPDDRRRRRR